MTEDRKNHGRRKDDVNLHDATAIVAIAMMLGLVIGYAIGLNT